MDPIFTEIVTLDVEPGEGSLKDYAVYVMVGGTVPLPHAQIFRARFDDEPVEVVTVDMYGTGFTGYLANRPPDDARLFVEFDDADEIDTGLNFSSLPPNT